MKKRLRILLLAFLAAAIVVPVGFALSLESAHRTAPGSLEPVSSVVTRPMTLVDSASASSVAGWPEGAKLVGVGSILFALAAVMRRTKRAD